MIGCKECSEDTGCQKCIDPDATLVNGTCICHEYDKRPDINGICHHCYSPGCGSCYNNSLNQCFRCLDSEATLVNGACQCPLGKYFNGEGYCDACSVVGCEVCSPFSNDVCLSCVDCFNTTIINGECVCHQSKHLKPNAFGKCSYCIVEGCASCLFDFQTCHRCADPTAILQNGICHCPVGESFDKNLKCQSCQKAHLGCFLCSSSPPH